MKKISWLSLLFAICLFFPITANAIKILEVVPAVGPIGFPVIIRGQNFNTATEIKTTVMFGNKESVEVEILSDTEIRAITPLAPSGAVDVIVNMQSNDSAAADTLPNGFTYDGFFVFDPAGDIGKEGGIVDPDSGQNIPIRLDIPLTSLPPNDRFPSIYVKPVTHDTLLTKGFEIERIVGDLIIEIKVKNGAGDMVTRFDDSIIITLSINSNQSPTPNVLLLSEPTGDKIFRPIPTKTRTTISLPLLHGKIKYLSADSNYLAAGVNQAPTINSPKVGAMSMADTVSITGAPAEIALTGSDSDGDSITFIITELPTGGYLRDKEVLILSTPFVVAADNLTYIPRTGYFGIDQFRYKVSDSAMESEAKVVYLDVSLASPKITNIAPKAGPISGGTGITITGENFVPGAKVYFGDLSATRVMFILSNQLLAITPSVQYSGTLPVKVVNPDGQSAVLSSGGTLSAQGIINIANFTFDDPPVVTAISPESGTMDGGTTITISGNKFIVGAVVYIGETKATNVQVTSSTTITAVTAPSPPGTFDVTVVTAGGTSEAGGTFTYTPVPLINTVSPTRIPTSGGMELEIIGENFTTDELTVTIGGNSATVTSISDTLIVVEAPSGGVGGVDVVVTTSDGQSAILTAGVTYISTPVVTSINPIAGPTSGGTSLTIRGANFVAGTTVTIGEKTAADITFVSATEITAKTPANEVGFFDMVVTKPSGEFTKIVSGFSYIAPPTITSVEPTEGAVKGGTPLTIRGINFDEAATVTINGQVGQTVSLSTTEITAITPPFGQNQQQSVDLVVTNIDGQSDNISFTYIVPPPMIVSVSPSIVSTAGGILITIKGSSFIEGLTVTIGGNSIGDVTFISDEEIQAQTPSNNVGAVTLQVTNPDGQSGQLAEAITYVDKPFIDSVTPNKGTVSGGTQITISGSNFDNDATVKIVKRGEAYASGNSAINVNVVSSTEITATTPAGTDGFVNVVVENLTAGFKTTLTGGFNYLTPPDITSVTPDSCSILGGQSIRITGSNFKEAATVTINGQVGQTVSSSTTEITAITPPFDQNQEQTVDLVVTNTDGQSGKISFTYIVPTPAITSVSPSIVTTAGGSLITIKGNGFIEGLTVTIDGSAINGTTFISDKEIQVQTLAHIAGAVTLQVANPGGQTGELAEAITYVEKPFIDSVTPNKGTVSGGTQITISGSNFDNDATVKIVKRGEAYASGNSAINVNVVSSTEITATTPAGTDGFADIVVENPTAGFKTTLTGGFNYLTPPDITSVTPNNGTILGGQLIRITGSNFVASPSVPTTVTIGDKEASDVVVVSSTEINAQTPPASAGKSDVVVKNPDGLEDRLVEGFEYVTPAPTINSVSPKNGPTAGGISITVSGINFFENVTVVIGGNVASEVKFISSSQIAATLPGGIEGTADVVVTNPDGQSNTLLAGFTYLVESPSITSISPDSGGTTGGISVTIKGEHFLAGVTVTIGVGTEGDATAALNVEVISSSEIHATVPDGVAGTADVIVTHTNWDSPVTLSDGFTYIALPPQIDSVQPSIGPVGGNTTISISGNYFVNGATVKIGGIPATNVVVTRTQITAETPVGSAGSTDVVVTNPDSQSDTLTDGFTYIPIPTVTAISPEIGPTSGGKRVTITGANFVDGATITIGGNAATDVVITATKIYAKTPAGSAGSADVVVSNPASQSDTLTAGFTYIPKPTVTSISPTSGPITGGTTITITGENFVDGVIVSISTVAANNVVFVSATQITAKTPAMALGMGTVDVAVTNPASQSYTMSDGFTYIPPPTVTSISPTSGPVTGGTAITITGENFQNGATVKIADSDATEVVFVSETQISAKTPGASTDIADVVVTNPDSQSDTLTDGFTYIPPPTVTSISPAIGPVTGGTAITITGENFQDGATVTIGGNDATEVVFVSETQMTAVTPGASAGVANVVVTNPDSQSDTLSAGFTYIPPPTVTAILPTSAPVTGGTAITITGVNFQNGATVKIASSDATDVVVVTDTQITAKTPAIAPDFSQGADSADVVVTNPDSQSGTLTSGFTYIPPPTVKSISPSRSPTSGGIEVIATGENFQNGATVKIGVNAATDVVVVSSTKITAKIPAGSSEKADVTVINPDAQSDTLTDGFTYVSPPTVTAISPISGSTSGGTKVTITGANFIYGVTIAIGGNAATNVVVFSSTQINAKTPAGTVGTVDVVVTNPSSPSDTLSTAFTYIPPPIVTAITPNSGPEFGGTKVTITGENIVSGATVAIGGNAATDVVVVSSTQITAQTPDGTAGGADVVITNPDNQTATLEDGFTYTPRIAADIAGIQGEGIPDGYVDALDLYTMGKYWHQRGSDIVADIASIQGEGIPDGYVEGLDLYTMGAHWHEGTKSTSSTILQTTVLEEITSNDDAILGIDFVYEDNSGADTIENTAAVGENFNVYIVAQNVVNLATYNAVINFDPSILAYVEADSGSKFSLENMLESGGGNMLGLMMDVSDAANGRLELTNALAGTENPPSGNGLLGVIKFTVQSAGETQISFGTGTKDNYLISAEGIADTSFINNGQLLSSGVVNETHWGDVSDDGRVTAYDAALVLQQAVGLRQFTPQQEEAANVDGTGGVTAYDAALILRYVVGIINEFPVQSGDAAPVANTLHYPEGTKRAFHIQIGNATRVGERINVPITVDDATRSGVGWLRPNTKGITAGNITIEYDTSILKPVGVSVTSLTEKYLLEYSVNVVPSEASKGQLSVAFAGENPLVGSGNLVMLVFEILPDAQKQNTRLTLTLSNLNDGLKAERRGGWIEIIPSQTALLQNYPNPFNPETWIPFQLAEDSEVSISIFALDGTLVRTLRPGLKPAGNYINRNKAAYWDGKNEAGEKTSSGLYFYTIKAGKLIATRKMILVK